MKGILTLVTSYIRFHTKKTVRTVAGIAVSVLLFVLCSNVILAGNQMARVIETEQNGAYHARFWDVTREQGDCIGQMEGVKTWEWIREGDVTYADVVFERPSKDIYGICEEAAENIRPGLAVTFHDELLSTYGIRSEENPGLTTYEMGFMVLAVMAVMFAVFLYNLFEFFLNDNRRYLGILEAIGATAAQKKSYVLLEALLVGTAGILAGAVLGSVLFAALWQGLGGGLSRRFSLPPMAYAFDIRTVLVSVLCGYLMLFLSCLIPLIKAGRVPAAVILKSADIPAAEAAKTSAGQFKQGRSAALNLMLRDFSCRRARYLRIIGGFIFFYILICFCFVWIGVQKGDYLLRDRREQRPPEQIICLNTEDPGQADAVFRELRGLAAIEDVTSTCTLDIGGSILDEESVKDGCRECSVYGSSVFDNPVNVSDTKGALESGYGMEAVLVGLDSEAFDDYAKTLGVRADGTEDDKGSAPVIIENYLLTDIDGRREYRPVLKEGIKGDLTIQVSRYGDMSFERSGREGEIDEFRDIRLNVLGVTGQKPDIPRAKADYEFHILNYSQLNGGTAYIYTPISWFKRLAEGEALADVVGFHPEDTVSSSYSEYKNIENTFYFQTAGDYSEEQLLKDIAPVFGKYGFRRISADEEGDGTWYYTSKSRIDKKIKVSMEGNLKIILYYGAAALLILFCFTGLFQFFYMEQKEKCRGSALLEMLGMDVGAQKRMLRTEYLAIGGVTIAAGTVGAVLVSLMEFGQVSKYQMIEARLPYGFLAAEAAAVTLFFVLMYWQGVRTIHGNRVSEWLRDE